MSLVILAALLIPMFIVARYDMPADDDFGYGARSHIAYVSGRGAAGILSEALENTKDIYNSWQGSFTATFLMALQPGIFGPGYYKITVYLLVLSFIAAVVYVFRRLLCDVFGIDKWAARFTGVLVSVFCIELVPYPNQSFYWFNGAVYYTFFYSLMLVLFGLTISYVKRPAAWRVVLMSVLAFLIGGANYVTALITVISGILAVIFLAIARNRGWKALIIPTAVALATMIISMVAPGNAVRQSELPNHPDALRTIKLAFIWGWSFIKKWTNLPWLGLMTISVPFMWHLAGTSSRRVKYPYIATVLSFCLFCAMFAPHLYASGAPGPERIEDIYFFSFIILSVINVYLWCGFLRRDRAEAGGWNPVIALASAAVAAGLVLYPAYRGQINLTSALAAGELRSGEAETYYNKHMERYAVIENSTEEDLVLDPIEEMPFLLFAGELTTDPEYYMNVDAATYFQKNSIRVK